jgi:hypothetical protein
VFCGHEEGVNYGMFWKVFHALSLRARITSLPKL